MKIAILGTRGFPNIQGGVEKYCEELCPRLVKFGCGITVFTRSPYVPKGKRVFESEGINFLHLWAPKNKNLETVIHTFLATLVCIFKRPDIAHFQNIGPAFFLPFLRSFGIKTVLTCQSINYRHQKWGRFARLMLRMGEFLGMKFADKVIVVSHATKVFLEEKYGRRDLEFIPNGVNLPVLIPTGDTLKKYRLLPKKYILTVCRLVPEKGVHDLIAAYQMLKDPEFKLVIAGDDYYETEYSRNIKESAKANADIVLTGAIFSGALQELYSNAGLFVLPSYYEGLPIVLLEAMSYGASVLISDIPANRELPLPEYRYFLPGDVDTLSKKILKLFNFISEDEKDKYNKILKEKYSWDRIAKRTFEVYKAA